MPTMEKHLRLVLRLDPALVAEYAAEYDEAIAKGAKPGPGCLWPDPAIPLSKPQQSFAAHFLHGALQYTAREHAELRARYREALAARTSTGGAADASR